MAYKGDWKKIKSLLAGSVDDGGRFITPLFAHWNEEPVRANEETSQYLNMVGHDYSYLVTLLKRHERYQVNLYIYILDFDKETPLMTEVKHFRAHDLKELINYMTTPSKLFKLNKKHKKVRLYSQERMSEEAFEKEVELCRGKQT